MTRAGERLTADAFTRDSVEAYLRAAAAERSRIELAIADERRRRDTARNVLDQLVSIGGFPDDLASAVAPTSRDGSRG